MFGNWKVLKLSENKSKDGKPLWVCECQCDKKTIKLYNRHKLTSGKTRSCGCISNQLRVEKLRKKHKNDYYFDGNVCVIIANNTKNKYLIDIEDYEKIKDYSWYETKRGYLATTINRQTVMLHRIIMRLADNDDRIVDHIFHDKTGNNGFYDNRKSNLRITSQHKNAENRRISCNNSSGTTGVSWSKNECAWKAYITYKGKRIHLGTYVNLEDAIRIRKEKEHQLFREYQYKYREEIDDSNECITII